MLLITLKRCRCQVTVARCRVWQTAAQPMTDSQGAICRSIPGKRLSDVLGLRAESRGLSLNFQMELAVERLRSFLKTGLLAFERPI